MSTENKSTLKRDKLIDIQNNYQAKWEEAKIYESTAQEGQEKYFVNFPFPYMNGKLHLGHAFSLTKAEFMSRYQRMKGKNVLFPFGFHCTGMPIQAAALKLKKQLEKDGNPPELTPYLGEDGKPLRKLTQYEILESMNIPKEEIEKFTDPYYWLGYFPPRGRVDLKKFGTGVDFRRSFITTDANPYFDKFVSWQFQHLKEQDKVQFGNRYSIFSPADNMLCADHDRSKGEGEKPKEFTIVKIKVLEPYNKVLEDIKMPEGAQLYFAAATLRPETMFGQTNCWLAPDGEYGAFQINDKEVFVMTERSARNLAFQGYSPEEGKVSCLGTFKGEDLFGTALNAPNAPYERIYTLPMFNIDMTKTTGVVTSVPSDSPDDLAAYRDLQKKEKLREKYGIKEEWVNLPLVPIISTPEAGDMAAEFYLKKYKIQSQNDRKKLEEAHEECYKEGFYSGVMTIGPYKGMPVVEAKPALRQKLIDEGLAIPYYEPSETVISRSGEVCVVALTPQWYINYGEEKWQAQVRDHLKTKFHYYNKMTVDLLLDTVEWLHEWGCSREFGLGTKLPADDRYVIESLSDSTIYMAYYTIAHLLQGGVLNGSKVGPSGIKPEQLTREVFDYIFLEKSFTPSESDPSLETLDALKKEFQYWYPFDLRVSAKDLIKNHLTMSLYNHAAIWGEKYMPRSIYANGYIMVDGEKMSKSQGNFLMMGSSVDEYSADAVRFALAAGGDTHSDANFETSVANTAILDLYNWIDFCTEIKSSGDSLRTGDLTDEDRIFESRINQSIAASITSFEEMRYRDLMVHGYHSLQSSLTKYRLSVGDSNFHVDVINRFIEVQTLILTPICPHTMDYIWRDVFKREGTVINQPFPVAGDVDEKLLLQSDYMHDLLHALRQSWKKDLRTFKKKNNNAEPTEFNIYVATGYNDWQKQVLEIMSEVVESEESISNPGVFMKKIKQSNISKNKKHFKEINVFVVSRFNAFKTKGKGAFEAEAPFDEIAFLKERIDFIKTNLGVEKLNIWNAFDDNVPDANRAGRAKILEPTMSIHP